MKQRFLAIGITAALLSIVSFASWLLVSAGLGGTDIHQKRVINFWDKAYQVFVPYSVDDTQFVPGTKSFAGSAGAFTLVQKTQSGGRDELVFGYMLGEKIFFKVIPSPCNLRTKEPWTLPDLVVGGDYALTLVGIQEPLSDFAKKDSWYPACRGIWRLLRPSSAGKIVSFFSSGKGFRSPWSPVADLTRVVLAANIDPITQ